MSGTHWLIVVGMLGAIGLQLANLHQWGDALRPEFVSAILLAVAANLGALFSAPPAKPVDAVSPRP